MHIPRHHEWGSLGQRHRSSIEVRHLVSASGEVLMLSDFSSARISSLSLYTHTHTELQEELSPALWSSANPSRFNTGAHSSRCFTCNCILHTQGISHSVKIASIEIVLLYSSVGLAITWFFCFNPKLLIKHLLWKDEITYYIFLNICPINHGPNIIIFLYALHK